MTPQETLERVLELALAQPEPNVLRERVLLAVGVHFAQGRKPYWAPIYIDWRDTPTGERSRDALCGVLTRLTFYDPAYEEWFRLDGLLEFSKATYELDAPGALTALVAILETLQ